MGDGDEWLRVRLPRQVSDTPLAVRLVVGRRVSGRWEAGGAVEMLDAKIEARSKWLTMLLWELQPPGQDSSCWGEFVRLFRCDPAIVLTPPDDFPLVPSPRPIADLDDRHAALVEQLTERLTGESTEVSILDAIPTAHSVGTVHAAHKWSAISQKLAAAVAYSPTFAATLMDAVDADSRGTLTSGDIQKRRRAVSGDLRTLGAAGPLTVEDLIARAVGPGSVLAGLFSGSGSGIDPQFISESIRSARKAFRARQLRDPSLANIKILCGMTRREGFLSRALAAELIHP